MSETAVQENRTPAPSARTAEKEEIKQAKPKQEKKAPVARTLPRKTPLYIDADNLIVGRMAAFVAERLLKGRNIVLLNAEKAVYTGNAKVMIEKWRHRTGLAQKGNPMKGPKYSKLPDKLLRHAVEGMVPKKRMRGREATKRLKVFVGIPKNYGKNKLESIEGAKNTKTKNILTVLQLAEAIGYHPKK
jgi:large subunit ribosomal protein L13